MFTIITYNMADKLNPFNHLNALHATDNDVGGYQGFPS